VTDDPGRHEPSDDTDLGAPVTELSNVSWPLDDRFATRVRGRIERRLVAGEFLELFWTAPLAMLLEFLRWPIELLAGRRK
jgi:hypothetical protein